MKSRSYKLPAAIILLVAAWGILFLGHILSLGVFQSAPFWVPLALLLVSGALTAAARAPARARGVIALVLVLTAAASASVFFARSRGADVESTWRRNEALRLARTFLAVGEEVARLQELSASIGETVGSYVAGGGYDPSGPSDDARINAFAVLDSLAGRLSRSGSLPPGTEIGIQVFDAGGQRFAWAGWPQSVTDLDRHFLAGNDELVYSREVSLYRILTHLIPVFDESGVRVATVLVDLPLEVNFRVNNRFLKSTSIAENIASDEVANVSFQYFQTPVNLPRLLTRYKKEQERFQAQRRRKIDLLALKTAEDRIEGRSSAEDSVLSYFPFPAHVEPMVEVSGDPASGIDGRVLIRSPQGNPILTVTAVSHPFRHYVDRRLARGLLWGKTFIVLALLVMFVLGMLALGRGGRLAWLRGVLFVLFLIVFRYSLLSFQSFSSTGGKKIFDPTVFATPLLGGIMRSAGDLFITSVFAVVAVYGLLKMIRKQRGGAEVLRGARSSRGWHFIVKSAVTVGVLIGVFELARRFTNVVVVNANPRLIGETMRLTDAGTMVLHLGIFLMLTGILLAGMLVVWGMFRATSWDDAKKTAWTTTGILLIIAVSGRWELALISVSLLLFIVFAPRYVQREDLVAVVIVSLCLVIITSGSAYLFLNRDYDGLRKNFVQEKASELVTPSDNWKVVILEDVLEEYSKRAEIRKALRDPAGQDVQRLAFDLWASGPLSLLGYSSSIHVLTARDSVISDFSVDMPYRIRVAGGNERIDTPVDNDWVVLDLTRNTPQGIVRYYRGILNIEDVQFRVAESNQIAKNLIGKVVVDLPFFFESLEWAAQTGPRTPEVLRNVQEGGVAPRVEEPEALLLARLDGRRVKESSSEGLPVGFFITRGQFERGLGGGWPVLSTGRGRYHFLVQETEYPDQYMLAGFAVPSIFRHLLRWSTFLSLYLVFTVVVIATIVLLSGIPVLKDLLPTLTPGRKLGFQQKLLVSFLVVALVPAVLLGTFSINFIKARFIEENRQEALVKVFSARKAIVNLLRSEMQFFLNQVDVNLLVTEEGFSENAVTGMRLVKVFNEAGEEGVASFARESEDAADEPGSRSSLRAQPVFVGSLAEASFEDIYVFWEGGAPYVGVLSAPMLVTGDDWSGNYYVYYARRMGSELLGEIADQVGADVNVYDDGLLVASSREGLLAGGFISAIMNAGAFVKVALLGSNQSLATERAGQYRYQVAYLPVTSWGNGTKERVTNGSGERLNAAMSVPLVFRPESYYLEVQRATSIILGIFALLFTATIGLGLFLARGIFEPLRGLLAGTRRIIGGDLNVRLPMRRSDEIGIVISAFNEMTEQLSESQRALDERRRYLETILVNIGTGVISTDAQDRIHTVNSAAERILGLTAGGVIGRPAADIADEGVAPEIFGLLRGGKDFDDPFVAAEIEVLRDGRRATIKYMKTKLNFEDRYLGTVFVFEDLTELIHSKKLSAWVEMARQIAHEIKNPLTPIRISTQFMLRAYEQKSDQFDKIFKESSKTIIDQVDVLKRIASEFSSYGRMQRLDVAPHQLAPLIKEIITPYERNSARVKINYDNGKPDATVLVDPEAVRKICSNLIENALEAMPNGGTLDVSCQEARSAAESFMRVSFSDSGPGLSAEAAEKLFEPYFSTKTTGTGLGLAICRSLSHEMGGDIEVQNAPGGGVKASVVLKMV